MAIGIAVKRENPRRRRTVQEGPTSKEREYLEVIYYLSMRDEPVISAQLARWMGVQPPTVTHAVGQLEQKSYILRKERGEIVLTEAGRVLAEDVVRRHCLLECFLLDVMGMPWHMLHEEAVRLEHALSPTMERYVIALVGQATTCPHGNPIPGTPADRTELVSLESGKPGMQFTIRRILEEAEEDSDLLQYLAANELIPGNRFFITDSLSTYGITLRGCNHDITISPEIAAVLQGEAVSLI
ncbi:MAG: metal-dependent transcriptional regulator [Chloroflexaceae bacterium]|nr:metal-dependent transcriptional regulator [Chloroflexaceae bacterium]NJL32585.1 metal-dependent transcriptional regulator [Chloroflexaceae bacterium]NJO04412.1 metal-dependent transcriptional regulator [Chloroflexaceae bacterium]